MSQTKWPLCSLPILKLDDFRAKQACVVFSTTQYKMTGGLRTAESLFCFPPDMEGLPLSTCFYSQ